VIESGTIERYGEKNCDNILSRFHLIPQHYGQTDGQTDGQNCYINITLHYITLHYITVFSARP